MNIILDSHISGAFYGWSNKALFKIGNQYWIQARNQYNYMYSFQPKAKIFEKDGNHFLEVERMKGAIEVKKAGNVVESQIEDAFKGWDGKTEFSLTNGQIWQQSEYSYMYHYAYRPNVLIYPDSGEYRLKVEGVKDTISVRKLR
ncbi:hypothetical protein P5G61_05880 [Paenibacillus sp. F6_3S_P_1C]|uniref:Uncharacterized protein n=1 Tax=Paenibacillus vandeheii TaxID=3035917 RepID=A0ABT8J6M9_9BACL|nr:hypothetical protein [Paenibacillus vandeheii]MDN4600747.1 hypothetical protein [Paenibacillus vandeheii]